MIRDRYGPPEVLRLGEVEKPTVGDRDLLIQVRAASLNRSDWEALVGAPLYARIGGMARVLGTDVAGVVEAVGAEVERFQPGDEVFGDVMYHRAGTFAEYVRVAESAPLVLKPPDLSFGEASTLPQAGVIALQGIRDRVTDGSRVLINGAGGGTGAFAIQLAKSSGAEVTGVDNAHKREFMLSVGADHVIDYTTTDYTRSGRYDLILDLVCHRSILAVRRAVAPGGRYSIVGGSVRGLLSALSVGRLLSTGGRNLGLLMVRQSRDDMIGLAEKIVSGELRVSIDQTFPLEDLPLALGALGDDRVLGKVVIEMPG